MVNLKLVFFLFPGKINKLILLRNVRTMYIYLFHFKNILHKILIMMFFDQSTWILFLFLICLAPLTIRMDINISSRSRLRIGRGSFENIAVFLNTTCVLTNCYLKRNHVNIHQKFACCDKLIN